VTTIEEGTFSGCTGLTSITIPGSVTYIKDRALKGCSNLTNVVVLSATPPAIDDETFMYTPVSSATLTVPQRSWNTYATSFGWKDFATIKEQYVID
jgi:hypothetical protein